MEPEKTLAMVIVEVAAIDEREIEDLASGLPSIHGPQLVVDITLMKSALTRCGSQRHCGDETKNTSARNCSRAWKCWRQFGHGRHRVF